MESKDLRIGNLVWDDYSGEMIVSQITYSTESVFLRKTWLLPDGRYLCKDIDPIPLTEEWLLKFDWFSIDEGRYTFRDIEYYSISNEGSLYFNGRYTCTDIKYVHQLQNLYFALTGNELQIK